MNIWKEQRQREPEKRRPKEKKGIKKNGIVWASVFRMPAEREREESNEKCCVFVLNYQTIINNK